ncbi:MAG: hypothetical protein HYX69_03700 [Planctomycetia bacterium]|nr:hypothetical protein [Planctomycetia bacterium]
MNIVMCQLRAAALVVLLLGPAIAAAAPDDEEPPPDAAAVDIGFAIDDSNFDQWLFQGAGNAQTAQDRIKARLKLQIDELDRVCGLTDDQKQKLSLAANGDIKRFFEEVEQTRQKFMVAKNDRMAFNNIWQEIQPLQMKQAKGLFGETSFFGKTLRKTLNSEQDAKYQGVQEERRRFRYRASIEAALTTLDNAVALRSDQRKALFDVVLANTSPPHVFGQYDYYVIMYQLAKVPQDKVKPIFDDRQWQSIQQQLNQYKQMKQFFVQNGILPEDFDRP